MTVHKNTYKPPIPPTLVGDVLAVPASEYDHNHVFDVKLLRTDRVELRPFVVCLSGLYVMLTTSAVVTCSATI
jgi:hypothetical protein